MDRDFVGLSAKVTSPLIITTPDKIRDLSINYKANSAFVKFMEISL
jgi:hypothetical protein